MVRLFTSRLEVRTGFVAIGAMAMTGLLLVLAAPARAEEPQQASINIRTVSADGDRLAGAVYVVSGQDGTFTSDADGKACVIGFASDSVWEVTQVAAPDGFELADPATQLVEVDDDGDCNSPDAVFVNAASEIAAPTPTPTQAVGPGQSPRASSRIPPRDDTLGGNPTPRGALPPGGLLPDTALLPGTPLPVLIVLASLTIVSLGSLTLSLLRRADGAS